MSVISRVGAASEAGPFIVSQQESSPGVVKLRVIKGVGGDFDGAYLFLQYDHPSPSSEHIVSVAVMTTQSVTESYELSNAASAVVVPVFSNLSATTRHFDVNQDAVFNGSVTIPSGDLLLGSESVVTPSYLTANRFAQKSVGAGINAALAVGLSSAASGYHSVALGYMATADGDHAIAIGGLANAGPNSTAIGNNSKARGTYNSLALMGGATGIGELGRESAAIGPGAITGAPAAFAIGYQVEALGMGSVAIGHIAHANAEASTSIGIKTRANSRGGVALGSANIGFGENVWSDTNSIFEVGNAWAWDPAGIRSNAITTMVNGRTTLTNKYWVASTPTMVPSIGYQVGGDALSVEGHTEMKGNARVAGNTVLNGTTTVNGDAVLNGKVTLSEAQGDISMGIYE